MHGQQNIKKNTYLDSLSSDLPHSFHEQFVCLTQQSFPPSPFLSFSLFSDTFVHTLTFVVTFYLEKSFMFPDFQFCCKRIRRHIINGKTLFSLPCLMLKTFLPRTDTVRNSFNHILLVLNQIQSDVVYFEGNRYFGFSNKASFILWLPNILQQVCFSFWLMTHYCKYLYVNVGRVAQSVQ